MNNIFETIKTRYSVRTYAPKPIENKKLEKLSDFLAANTKGPFGNSVNFKIIGIASDTANELKKYISYGSVKGACAFIAGSVKKGEHAMEDFGYCMEKNVLMATSLGLGTVWLGGSFKRSTFASKLNLSDDEVIPAITPLGYATDKRSMMDKVIRTLSNGNNRLDFEKLFFSENLSTPLNKASSGKYTDALESVRLAPSAANKQPWRIVKEKNKNTFHFYMNEHAANRAIKDIQMQNNDMGIAMSHFELTANELGLQGSWHMDKPNLPADNLVYIVSFKDLTSS